jgi:hypothetical protein
MSNLRNEIVWCYRGGGSPKKDFGRRHDTIFRYSKSESYVFNSDSVRIPYEAEGLGRKDDAMWGKHKGTEKVYKPNPLGKIPEEWWLINVLNGNSPERIGYPTKKPESLLRRIIECASNSGDLVLDPFVGGGTTLSVADRLHRRWIGIDQSVQAIKVTELRLSKHQGWDSAPFVTKLHKYDYDTLRYGNAFEFESWIIEQFGGESNARQRGDYGLDGKMSDNTPIQVKRSDNIGRNVIDNFLSAVKRADKKIYDSNISNKQPIGYIIAFSFGKGAIEEVARLKLRENIIIELVLVEKIVPIARKPKITVEVEELLRDTKGESVIGLTAFGKSETGIQLYSWDFQYKEEVKFNPDIMIDREGKHSIRLKSGEHTIAVKVVDNDGLENMGVIKLKVNGKVERT